MQNVNFFNPSYLDTKRNYYVEIVVKKIDQPLLIIYKIINDLDISLLPSL